MSSVAEPLLTIGFCLQWSCADHMMTGKISKHPRTAHDGTMSTAPDLPVQVVLARRKEIILDRREVRLALHFQFRSCNRCNRCNPSIFYHPSNRGFARDTFHTSLSGYVSDPSLDRMPLRFCARFPGGSGIYWLFFKFCDRSASNVSQLHTIASCPLPDLRAPSNTGPFSQVIHGEASQLHIQSTWQKLERSQCHRMGFLTATGSQGVWLSGCEQEHQEHLRPVSTKRVLIAPDCCTTRDFAHFLSVPCGIFGIRRTWLNHEVLGMNDLNWFNAFVRRKRHRHHHVPLSLPLGCLTERCWWESQLWNLASEE